MRGGAARHTKAPPAKVSTSAVIEPRSTLLISDLHLKPELPHLSRMLISWLQDGVTGADALYVLGDLFEAWPGDDDASDPFNAPIISAFRALSDGGIPLYFQHGNRDFLLGEEFMRLTGGRLLPEEHIVSLAGTPTLLMHGDQLCTDDVGYQQFRTQVRNPQWQRAALRQPLAARKQLARAMREGSVAAASEKTMDIMDVNPDAVAEVFRRTGVSRLIHGHTHRPAHHRHQVDGRECERIVLADWRESGAYLEVDADDALAHAIEPEPDNGG